MTCTEENWSNELALICTGGRLKPARYMNLSFVRAFPKGYTREGAGAFNAQHSITKDAQFAHFPEVGR